MLKPLETRVDELEDFMADMPGLINIRFEGVQASFHETNSRISILDRQVAGLVRDVRDLRGGVTQSLVLQNRQIAEIKVKVTAVEAEVQTGFADVRSNLAEVRSNLAEVRSNLSEVRSNLAEILLRLPKR